MTSPGSDYIKYNPAVIESTLAGYDVQRRSFQEGADMVEAAYKRLEASSQGDAIVAAQAAQAAAQQMRAETIANATQLKMACHNSAMNVARDDQKFAAVLG